MVRIRRSPMAARRWKDLLRRAEPVRRR
uniref:Uncharacterized protein n=1 Tax=Arundo donax TaxID=35708 RepID=A0A0A9I252_ARUDO